MLYLFLKIFCFIYLFTLVEFTVLVSHPLPIKIAIFFKNTAFCANLGYVQFFLSHLKKNQSFFYLLLPTPCKIEIVGIREGFSNQ